MKTGLLLCLVLRLGSALSLGSNLPANLPLHWSRLPSLPDRLGVAGAFAGVSEGTLLVGGGANFPGKMPWEGGAKVWHDQVYALSSVNGHWRCVGQLPRPLAYGVSVTTKLGVICLGGRDQARTYREVFLLSLRQGNLVVQPYEHLPLPLANAAGALVGSSIYLAGGSDQTVEESASRQCFTLDLATPEPKWVALPAFPGKARILAVAAAGQDTFYLFGGAALESTVHPIMREYLRDAWSYQPRKGWQRLADLPRPCVAGPSPAPVLNGSCLLLGGDDGKHANFQPPQQHPGFSNTILAYDLRSGIWCTDGEIPAARATLPLVVWQDHFVLPSGEVRPGVRSPEVWMFGLGDGQ